jgi:hypothetical protein
MSPILEKYGIKFAGSHVQKAGNVFKTSHLPFGFFLKNK